MKLNKAGIDLIKSFEGCKLKAYPDPATKSDPWTIGYGHTGPEVVKGLVWTQEEADRALNKDLDKFCKSLTSIIKCKLSENQFSALVSLVYNIGTGNFRKSTLLKLINTNELSKAALEFPKWSKANGKQMAGLLRRRLAEQELFLKN